MRSPSDNDLLNTPGIWRRIPALTAAAEVIGVGELDPTDSGLQSSVAEWVRKGLLDGSFIAVRNTESNATVMGPAEELLDDFLIRGARMMVTKALAFLEDAKSEARRLLLEALAQIDVPVKTLEQMELAEAIAAALEQISDE
jgi:hypothetical protein